MGGTKVLRVGNRRRFLCCCACVSLGSLDSTAQVFPDSAATVLPPLPEAPGCGSGPGKDTPNAWQNISRSGIREVDDNLARETELLRKLFGVEPDFTFVQGMAEPSARTRHLRATQKTLIFMDVRMIREEQRINPRHWQSAIIGVLAHEYAHALQFDSGLGERSNLWETQADYLSGWYLGNKVLMGLSALNIDAYADALFRRGSKSGFFDEQGYGPPEARAASATRGFQRAYLDFDRGKLADIRLAAGDGYKHAMTVVR